jgi:hypothetical protein
MDTVIDMAALNISKVVVNNVDTTLRMILKVSETPKFCHWISVGSGALSMDIDFYLILYWQTGL